MSKALFIVGTGTDVGKTYVTGLILKALGQEGRRAAYYKAAMSGNRRRRDGSIVPGDGVRVRELSGVDQPLEEMCPYVYETEASPHLAARLEGRPVEREKVLEGFDRLCRRYDYVTAEGSGGVLCPLRFDGEEGEKLWLEDVLAARRLPCVVVADAGLGAINAVGLTAAYLQARGIPCRGLVLNRYRPGDPVHEDNRRMCRWLTGWKVLACVREGDRELGLSGETVAAWYEPVGGVEI